MNGTSTENALVRLGLDAGMDVAAERRRFPRLSVQHRSDSYRFMLTRHAAGGRILVAVKGSPQEVLELCARRLTRFGPAPLGEADREQIAAGNMAMARDALR